MAAEEMRRQKARNLRYRKPVVKDLNLESIEHQLGEISEACGDVHWYMDSEDGNDTLINALDGDIDEAWEFRMAFSDLEADANQMLEDMQDEYIPDCFDLFFAGVGAAGVGGGMLGYDEYEGDYFGLSQYETELAERGATERLKRLTKDQIIDAVGICLRVAISFVALRSRYDDLKAAMDILREQNTALLQQVKAIEEAYDLAEKECFYSWGQGTRAFDRLLGELPDRVWIE